MTFLSNKIAVVQNAYGIKTPTSFSSKDVSIIVPVKNDHARLCRLIRSLNMGIENHYIVSELIICDDKSNEPINDYLKEDEFGFNLHITAVRLRTE